MRLVISGTVPSKKNNKQIFRNSRTGKRFITSSDVYRKWNNSAIAELKIQFAGFRIVGYPISMKITFYPGGLWRKDLDNQAGSVMDTLKDAGVIEDDDTKHIKELHLFFGGYDKENPRCEIEIQDS